MQEYELCIEAMTPCGGSKYARREILEVATDSPERYVRENAMFPILDIAECEDMIIITTGDGHGYITRYSFTK